MGNEIRENEIGKVLVNVAIDIHKNLGPGLLESVYEVVLAHEMEEKGFSVNRQLPIDIVYKNIHFAEASRADLMIDDKVIVELKSIEDLTMAHRKQLLTYLRLGGKKLGFILNFGSALMREGIVRIVNGLPEG